MIEKEENKRMTTIYFVRHAQPDHTKEDRFRPLTEEGLQDSKTVLEFFRNKKVDTFYCSPYLRSLQTIQETAEYFNKEIITDERLREREAGPNGNNREMFQKRWADHSYHEEGGEALNMVQKRNCEALDEILCKNEDKCIVIGTHGTALSTILNHYQKDFGCEDFLRIIDWMPYIIELDFKGKELIQVTEHVHVVKEFKGKCAEKKVDYITDALQQYGMQDEKAELIRHNENMTYRVAEHYLLRIHKHAEGFTTDPIYDGLDRSKLYQEELGLISYLKDYHHVEVLRYDDMLCDRLKGKLHRAMEAQIFDPERSQIMSDALDVIAHQLVQVRDEFIPVHSDLSLSNLLITEQGIAPIDFSLFGLCHPMMDLSALYCNFSGVENRRAIADGYQSTGRSIDYPVLDCCFALNILLGIVLHCDMWPKQDWFDARLSRWCEETFGPLRDGKRLFADDFYLINVK